MMRCVIGALCALLLALPALAATIHVPTDQPTLQAGIDAAAAGDTVQIADGIYLGHGNRDLDCAGKPLVIRSGSGDPAACVVDCGGSEEDSHRFISYISGEGGDSALEGIGIVGGWFPLEHHSGGGAVYCDNGSSPTFRNCIFRGNHGSALYFDNWSGATVLDCLFKDNLGLSGGAAHLVEGDYTFTRCIFTGNHAAYHGGALHGHAADFTFLDCVFTANRARCGAAINMIYSCTALFERCRFDANIALEDGWRSIINLHGFVTGEFADCTFSDNVTGMGGDVIVTSKMSHGIVRGCTFWRNSVPNGYVVHLGESDGRIDNTIISGSPAGRAAHIGNVLSLTCCDFHGNADGDWVDSMEPYLGVDGNICADPLFCAPEAGDFELSAASPCAPFSDPNPECGLIGAWPVGCGPTLVKDSSWGAIKSLYRR
jgi:hypothetical protein